MTGIPYETGSLLSEDHDCSNVQFHPFLNATQNPSPLPIEGFLVDTTRPTPRKWAQFSSLDVRRENRPIKATGSPLQQGRHWR